MLELKSKDLTLLLPQSFAEVDFEFLKECVSHIDLAPYRCIVAVISKASLSEIANPKSKTMALSLTVVVKRSDKADETSIVKTGKQVYANIACVQMGLDINSSKNVLSRNSILGFIESDADLRRSVFNGEIFRKASSGAVQSILSSTGEAVVSEKKDLFIPTSNEAVFVGFKIINESDIEAVTDFVK